MLKNENRELVTGKRYGELQLRWSYGTGTVLSLLAWLLATARQSGDLATLGALVVAFFGGMFLGSMVMGRFYIESDDRT